MLAFKCWTYWKARQYLKNSLKFTVCAKRKTRRRQHKSASHLRLKKRKVLQLVEEVFLRKIFQCQKIPLWIFANWKYQNKPQRNTLMSFWKKISSSCTEPFGLALWAWKSLFSLKKNQKTAARTLIWNKKFRISKKKVAQCNANKNRRKEKEDNLNNFGPL